MGRPFSVIKTIIMNKFRYLYRYFRNNIFRILAILNGQKLEFEENIVIISPHPDDEILGCGGIITHTQQKNQKTSIIFLTKGESCTKSIDSETLKAERKKLTEKAMTTIDQPLENVFFLDFGDGKVSIDNPEIEVLIKILNKIKPSAIFVPHKFEGWNDHFQANLLIKSYIGDKPIKLFEYCVWFWYTMPFNKIFEIDWSKARIYKMERDIQKTKYNAIRIYMDGKNKEGIPYSGNLPSILIKSCSWKEELYFEN